MTLYILKHAMVGAALASICACSLNAPKYTPVPSNVNALRDANLGQAKVGSFSADPKASTDVNRLSIRGTSYVSPYNESYVDYLKEALRLELDEARVMNSGATVELSGVLIRNELDTGMTSAHALIEARFIVKRGDQIRYDKVKTAKYEWESHFVGAIAIPRSQENYPVVVQKLLTSLYSDPDFLAAFKN